MPVTTTHPTYDAMRDTWQTLRDVYAGDTAIKAAGQRYLPKPQGLTTEQYAAYVQRPAWFGATRRTVIGMRGAAFRQDPVRTGVDGFSQDLEDVTGTGMAFVAFAKLAFLETLLMGRYGALVEWSDAAGRPYWAGYRAECIRTWRVVIARGQPQLTLVVLDEQHEADDPDDPYTQVCTTRYRVLRLVDGLYVVEVYEQREVEVDGETDLVDTLIARHEPTKQGQRLDFIPFTFISPSDVEAEVEESPVQDLADLNLRHWRRSAGYEHGLYLTGLPTLVITGHDPSRDMADERTGQKPTDIVLGSQEAIVLPETDAEVAMLEFQGQGLGAVAESLETSKHEMAVMGARLLEEQARGNETATAVMVRQSGDASIARTLTGSVSSALTRLLRWDAWWRGVVATPQDERVTATLNRDFFATSLNPQQLVALMQMHQVGQISFETFYHNLQSADMAEPGIDAEVELERIRQQMLLGVRGDPDEDAA